MTDLAQLNGWLQKVGSDIRIEVILTDLITEGLSMDDVVLVSNSLFKRNYHHDIESVSEIEYGTAKKKKLCFVVNREGIYDRLPEDLFHEASETQNDTDKEGMIQEIKVQNEVEKQSRLFFLPLENEFHRQRVKLELEERKFLFETNSALPSEIFDQLWELPEFMDDLQKSKVGVLIPVLNKIAGNIELAGFIIESITGDRVSITKNPPGSFYLTDAPELGEMRLGFDSILGGQVPGLQSGFKVSIFLNELEELTGYMPGGKKIAIHEFLCNLLMPLDTDIVFEPDFSEASAFFIAENDKPYLGRLNYTTVI
jgi:hypothetical protein